MENLKDISRCCVIVDSRLKLGVDELRKKDAERILKKLTFATDNGQVVQCYRLTDKRIILPRGAWSEIPNYIEYRDRRSLPELPTLNFKW